MVLVRKEMNPFCFAPVVQGLFVLTDNALARKCLIHAVHAIFADHGQALGGVVPIFREGEHEGQQALGLE